MLLLSDGAEPVCTEPGAAHEAKQVIISSKSGAGWGGARANSGGARPNSGGSRPGAGRPKLSPILPAKRHFGPRWWVLQMYAGTEARVIRDLAQGESRSWMPQRAPYQVELPMTLATRMMRGKRVTHHVPMLAGYGFAFLDLDVDDITPLVRFDPINGRGVDGLRLLMATNPVEFGIVENWIADAPERLKLQDALLEPFLPHQALLFQIGDDEHKAECIACDGRITKAKTWMFGREIEMTLPREKFRKASKIP